MVAGARPFFIVNPAAGGGRAARAVPVIRAAMRAERVAAEVVCSTSAGDASALARRAAREGYRPVAGVGGDGTLQAVVNGLLAEPSPPPLAGTGNDFARSLGLPRRLDAALRLVCRGEADLVDVGRCGERFYLNIGGVGMDAEVAASLNRRTRRGRSGRLAYLLAIVAEVARYRNREVIVSLDGRPLARRALLVAVGNGAYYGGGQMICPAATMTDGLLDICIVGDVPRWEVLWLLPGVAAGRHVRHPKVECYRARRVRIEAAPGVRVHLDGEGAGHPPVEFSIVPGALRVVGAGRPAGQAGKEDDGR
jgi:diacylglycerol kinase (ATP)